MKLEIATEYPFNLKEWYNFPIMKGVVKQSL